MGQIDPDQRSVAEPADVVVGNGLAPRLPSRQAIGAALLVILLTVVVLRVMGRTWWCQCATPHIFVAGVWSEHNSQHVLDPYAFSHIQHGLVLYALLVMIAPRLSPGTRAVMAIVIECGWEVIENTSWIIDKYRESTVSLEYYGDSIVNSVADIAACAVGYAIAASVPTIASAIGFLTIELVMLLLIRDSFLLNVVMLVYPLEAIKQWQLGSVPFVNRLLSCAETTTAMDGRLVEVSLKVLTEEVVQ